MQRKALDTFVCYFFSPLLSSFAYLHFFVSSSDGAEMKAFED
jgi:hypothetical protein